MRQDNKQERVTNYVRKDGTKVRSHTRNAQWARAKSTWISAGFSTLTAAGILWEAGVTLMSTLALLVVAVLGTIAIMVGRYVEHNRQTMAKQQQTRKTTRTARTGRTTSSRARTSSSRSRASSQRRTTNSRSRR